MKLSVEDFYFSDYSMRGELVCSGSSSPRAVRHKQVCVDIAFVDYSIWLIYAICCGIHSPIPSTKGSGNAR